MLAYAYRVIGARRPLMVSEFAKIGPHLKSYGHMWSSMKAGHYKNAVVFGTSGKNVSILESVNNLETVIIQKNVNIRKNGTFEK